MTTDATDTNRKTRMKDGPAWPKGQRVAYVRQMALAEDGNHYSTGANSGGPVVEVWAGIVGDVVIRVGADIGVHFPESPTPHVAVLFDPVHALYCLEPVDE